MLTRLIGIAPHSMNQTRKLLKNLISIIDNIRLALVGRNLWSGGWWVRGSASTFHTAGNIGGSRTSTGNEGTAGTSITGLGTAKTRAPRAGFAGELKTTLVLSAYETWFGISSKLP